MQRLEDIMSRKVLTFSPETTIREALATLSRSRMSGAPVVSNGKVCGLISIADIAGVLACSADPGAAQQKTVSEVMSGRVYELPSRAPVRRAASMMREKQIHRVLVIDDGRLVGVVSALDVARAVSDAGVGTIHVINPHEDIPSPWISV
jgi:CBS domain-containing protein